jgi:hypothetical protein
MRFKVTSLAQYLWVLFNTNMIALIKTLDYVVEPRALVTN